MKYSKAWASPFLIWIAIGTVVPVFSIAYYGFSNRAGHFTFDNIGATFSPDHMEALGLSLLLAFVSTAVCFILALPMAMILSNSRHGKTGMVIFIFILPMWMNFLLRTMAWQVLLEREGVINSILHAVGLPGQHLINTPAAIHR